MANRDFKYFYEDEVFRVTKKGTLQFGMVIENAEFHSSDESSDGEEPPVKAGQVRVAWYPSGSEEVVVERKVHLADRSLMPGDVVRRLVQGRSTQRGYCRDVTVYSSVQVIGTNQVIYGVKSALLTPLEAFKSDILICLDSWVGMVRNVKSKLTVRFNDGSKVIIDDDVAEELDDIRDKRDPECEFKRYDFYPGQILFGPVRLAEAGEWLECSAEVQTARRQKPHKGYKMTVEDIEFKSLGVSWICRAYFSSNDLNEDSSKMAQPKYKVEGEHLARVRMLNVFEPCTLQIGDRNFYTMQEDDLVMMKPEWKRLQKEQLYKGSKREEARAAKAVPASPTEGAGGEGGDNSSDFEDCDEDSDAASVSSLESAGQNIEGESSKPKKKAKTQTGLMTKVLKKKKLRKTRRGGVAGVLVVKAGDRVVTETLSTRSEVEVVWQDGTVERDIPSKELYPIHHLDDHEFFPGDFVTEAKDGFHPHSYGVVQDVDHAGRCCKVKWFRTYTEGAQPQPIYVSTTDASVYDLKDHPDFKYRPGSIVIRVMNKAGDDCGLGAGQVLDNQPSGQVSVWWAGKAEGEGVRSACWPQDLYKVGEYDSDDGELWEDEEDEEEGSGNDSWETESEQEVEEEVKDEDLHTDAKDLKPKLVANIEKARVAMTRLEEIFSENQTVQTADVMRQLLDVHRDCRQLDRLMGTAYFDETNFGGLLDRIRDQDRISSMEAAVKQHVTRLFSSEDVPSPGKELGVGPEPASDPAAAALDCEAVPDSRVCGRLCSMIKCQLIKSHEEVVRRFGHPEEADNPAAEFVMQEQELAGVTSMDTEGPATPGGAAGGDPGLPSPLTPGLHTALDSTAVLSPGSFQVVESVPLNHKFKLTIFQPVNARSFMKHVRTEMRLLQSALPPGIIVKGYEERMDLFSAMIHGPKSTPYEDGLFFFDFQLPADYPASPPLAHYVSFCSDRLNPNLYEDGKVCVSLLGTWQGKGSETWSPESNLLQVLVSIQGLILVREPYFNEAGYEKQKGAQQGSENSRMYNEMAVLKLVQSMTKLIKNPQFPFRDEIKKHFRENGGRLAERLLRWKALSTEHNKSAAATPTTPGTFARLSPGLQELPDFPLVPASRGFCLTLDKSIKSFQEALAVTVMPVEMELPLD